MTSFEDLLKYSMQSLSHKKLRSYLTVLGIVIGVTSVVTLISLSDGLYASVDKQLEEFGGDVVIIVPGGPDSSFSPSGGGYIKPTSGRLFEKDLDRVSRIVGVEGITKSIQASRTTLLFKGENVSMTFRGIEPSKYNLIREVKLSEGRYLSDNDRNVAIVGSNFASTDIFDQPMAIGSIFYAGPQLQRVRVIGILDSSSAVGATNILMPFDDVAVLAGDSLADKELFSIVFRVPEAYDFDDVISNVKSNLAASRGVSVDDPDFSVVTSDFILEQVGSLISALSAILGFIIGVSLVVGAVGVANTMFVSVMEKTKEIGTLKAIGARSHDILAIIILESAMIGLMGGLIGVAIAFVIVFIVSLFDFEAIISVYTVVLALLFSILVSVAAGFVPAYNASKLSPVVAMRRD